MQVEDWKFEASVFREPMNPNMYEVHMVNLSLEFLARGRRSQEHNAMQKHVVACRCSFAAFIRTLHASAMTKGAETSAQVAAAINGRSALDFSVKCDNTSPFAAKSFEFFQCNHIEFPNHFSKT